MEMGIQAVWAADPEDVSLLHVLTYAHSGGGFESLLGTEEGAQQQRFVGGSQLVSLRMAEALGDAVVLEAPVRRIEHGPDHVRVHADGGSVAARSVVVAIPPALAGRIAYDPPLSGMRDQLTQRIPQGNVIKTMAVYERPFWREDGLSGIGTSDVGPTRAIFDNSPPSGSPGVLLAFLEGRYAREWSRRSLEERRDAIVGTLARLFGPRAAKPERYIERSWADEEWTRGCYGAHMPTGAWTSYGHLLREPVGRIHWASAETADVWMGYMDGAVRSGERAARAVLADLAAEREPAVPVGAA
jgi:monoamine oxidase